MQPQSMTGFGRGESGNFKVEVRSSNHKNLDIHINVPHYLYSYDPAIRKGARKKFNRGRIDIFIPKQEVEGIKLKVNKVLAREYYDALNSIKDELSISDDISINVIASQRDIFIMDEPEIDETELLNAVDAAFEELNKTRVEEGGNLMDDIKKRLILLDEFVSHIEDRREEYISDAKKKLHDKLKELLDNVQIDEARLIQETAIIIEKSDITEEIVRLRSHLKQFDEVIKSGDTIGKKLDFMIQEMRREINTVSSKTHDIDITKNVVEMRHEIEKIKEQVQNLQ
jgi:uncharacterized protein (TIGR00255 family)